MNDDETEKIENASDRVAYAKIEKKIVIYFFLTKIVSKNANLDVKFTDAIRVASHGISCLWSLIFLLSSNEALILCGF